MEIKKENRIYLFFGIIVGIFIIKTMMDGILLYCYGQTAAEMFADLIQVIF